MGFRNVKQAFLPGSKYDSIYSTKFIVKRDEAILKEYISKYIENK